MGVGVVGPVGGRALVGMLGRVLGLGLPTGFPFVPLPLFPATTVIRKTNKGPSKGARGSPAHQQGAGTLREQRQHKIDDPGGWMGRGGRITLSSASPRKVGSHTNKGTVKGSNKRSRGSPAHQQRAGTQKEQRLHKIENPGGWMGRGGRTTVSSASPRKVGSQSSKGTLARPDDWA